MKLKLSAVLIAAMMATPANAAFLNGNDLHELCRSSLTDRLSDEQSSMFVMGVADALQSLSDGVGICIPNGVNGGQVRDVVCRSLSELPELRHMDAGTISMVSLAGSFPC